MFMLYEATLTKNPIITFALVSNRTSMSGYLQTFLLPVVSYNILYFGPVYFQACFGSSAICSGVLSLPLVTTLEPCLMLTGISITATKQYRPQLWLGWALYLAGMGGMLTLAVDTPFAHIAGFLVLQGVGSSMIYATTYFPILALLPIMENAHALVFFAFCRSFAPWLPICFVGEFPGGVSIAYSVIPVIGTLPELLRIEVRITFADSLDVLWHVCIGITGAGLLVSLLMGFNTL
ncbi:uncharacterized protein PHACADRAFT_198414 [Phanerochaete carnosa HHB-10118-sp]|uniref:Uncharacterized protein n=1 Tax=Phanerochaete carnosa (strain HHB-10118-sp) TaxID=650164 RepID=K5VLS6_PHACS|nr:uncharacterized protein PHACADRAFT_198414 [Phanerochaete carnosa HHB-10118-sp]EKM52353.1 hypothetical protein PHACADRAFT_198414 [Phanerochaete carnosa HHB-10118-sp]